MNESAALSCPLCRRTEVTILLRGIPDRFRPESTYGIARCRDCRLAFTNPYRESYPAHYGPHQVAPRHERTTGTRAAIVRTFYRGEGSPVDRLRLAFPYLVFRLRDRMKVRARDFYARPFRRRGRLLDIGCGAGNQLAAWKGQQDECVGVERDAATARRTGERLGLDVRPGRLEEQDFPPGSFDVITLSHVLEHVEDPRSTLGLARRFIRPGGELLIWIPNFNSLQRRFAGPAWLPYDVPRHRWHFRPEDAARLLKECGFRAVEILPDPHEWSVRHTARALTGWKRRLLKRRRARLLAILACMLFRRTDTMRIRAVPD